MYRVMNEHEEIFREIKQNDFLAFYFRCTLEFYFVLINFTAYCFDKIMSSFLKIEKALSLWNISWNQNDGNLTRPLLHSNAFYSTKSVKPIFSETNSIELIWRKNINVRENLRLHSVVSLPIEFETSANKEK